MRNSIFKKGLVLALVAFLICTGIISAIDCCSVIKATQTQEKGHCLASSDFFDPKMTIPEHCFNLSKAPSVYEDIYDPKIKHKEEFNFPIGNFGNSFISYDPHGIDRIALYNNFFDAFGGDGTGSYNPRCLNGTFLGVYINDSKNKVTRILQQYSPTARHAKDYGKNYGVKPVEKMECYSNIPIGYYLYHDAAIPVELGLRVYSPLLLYDLKNSSLPTSIWVFNAYNPTDHPVEVSFLFSLENDIGWRNKVNNDSTWQRTGTYNYIQEDENSIGVKFTYDKDQMSMTHPEYLGNMTLVTLKQPNVTISHVSEWDTSGDGNDLWYKFSNEGTLNNKNNSNRAIEGKHIYAGALSTKVVLEPGEGKNIPFVLSTCFPIFNLSNGEGKPPKTGYEWYWTNFFNDSWTLAQYSIGNYESWWKDIRGWQDRLYNSGLPSDLTTYMLGSLSGFVSKVFFSKDLHWFTYTWSFDNVYVNSYADWFFCMFYPEVEKYIILDLCNATDKNKDGYCQGSLKDPNGSLLLHQDLSFVVSAYRAWLWNQDEAFVKRIYSTCKNVTEYRIKNDVDDKDGLIHNIGDDLRNDMWAMPTSSSLNSEWLLSLKCMVSMATRLHNSDDVQYYEGLFEKAQNAFIDTFWYKSLRYEYFKLCKNVSGLWAWWTYPKGVVALFGNVSFPIPIVVRDSTACMIEQIVGVWRGKLLDEDILPVAKTKTALKSIYEINQDHDQNLGWITSVMGNPPYSIDRFGVYLCNMPNQIVSYCQWSFASSLLAHGLQKEGLQVVNITVKNNLYERGGVYFGDDESIILLGTNTRNIIGQSLKDFIKGKIMWSTNKKGKSGGVEDVLGPPYPPRVLFDPPSWSLYQTAAGFTPCVDGLKIKPRIGGNNVVYITEFTGCKIEMNVTGSGDFIDSAEINGDPYSTYVDGNVFIPIEEFKNQDRMYIHITLS